MIDLEELKKHINSQLKIKYKANSKGLDFDASLNLDVAKELIERLESAEKSLSFYECGSKSQAHFRKYGNKQ